MKQNEINKGGSYLPRITLSVNQPHSSVPELFLLMIHPGYVFYGQRGDNLIGNYCKEREFNRDPAMLFLFNNKSDISMSGIHTVNLMEKITCFLKYSWNQRVYQRKIMQRGAKIEDEAKNGERLCAERTCRWCLLWGLVVVSGS